MTQRTGHIIWNAEEAAQATAGHVQGDWQANGVSIDSRTLAGGELFIALKGPNFDGHDFAAAALDAGAAACMVDNVPDGLGEGAPLLVVKDTMAGLEALGRAARERTDAKIIAITGSVGKTGTKELLRTAFGALGRAYASASSHNNQWGVPLSLSNMADDTDFGIFELGMNHPGEITELTKQVRPDIAIVTTIAPVHVGHFDSVAQIAEAKAEIFDGMDENGIAILNADNEFFGHLGDAARAAGIKTIYSFGEAEGADARLVDIVLDDATSVITADILGQRIEFTLGVPGRHIAMNALSVLLAVAAAGADVEKAAKALSHATPVAGRGERVEITATPGEAPVVLIDESYNASPVAVRAAMKVLGLSRPVNGGRRIAVLGDMLELGAQGPRLHAELADAVRASGAQIVLTCGRLMENLHRELQDAGIKTVHAENSNALVADVLSMAEPGDVVLVKGSLGSRMQVIVDALKSLDNTQDTGAGSRVHKREARRHAV